MNSLIDNKLFNITSFNILLFETYSKEKILSTFDTSFNLNTVGQAISVQLWIISIVAAIFVGMAGIIPLIFIPFTMKCINSQKNVGGLLGDVFLHLLPETWDLFASDLKFKNDNTYSALGCWVLMGNATFILIQMILTINERENQFTDDNEAIKKINKNMIVAYLNLIANGIDNFSHGLAVGASFVIGYKVGILTTIAIIFHEVPHEFADFAILMKSGMSRWNAIKAQLLTASIGIFGTIFSLVSQNFKIDGETSITTYIIPFTAGGFLHIALTSILPELIKEDDPVESIKQLAYIILGVIVMGVMNCLAT